MSSHMNRKQRVYWFNYFAIGGKNWCKGCGHQVFLDSDDNKIKRKAIVEHKNNDSRCNQPWNIQIFCYTCNKIKNPSTKFEPRKVLTQSEATNKRVETKWRDWLIQKILNCGPEGLALDEAIFSGAELFECSPETIERRYLPKMLSNSGQLKLIDNMLFIKGMEMAETLKDAIAQEQKLDQDSQLF